MRGYAESAIVSHAFAYNRYDFIVQIVAIRIRKHSPVHVYDIYLN